MQTQLKQQRIEIRLMEWQKAMLQQAAKLRGVNVSDFLLANSLREAEEVIKGTEEVLPLLELSPEDQLAIAKILMEPAAEPTEGLNELIEHARRFEISSVKRRKQAS